MPSPVIGSVTAAASPTNSARPMRSGTAPSRAGMGQARGGPSGLAPSSSVPQARAAQQVPPAGPHVADLDLTTPQHPEADVGAAAGQRERPGVAGQEIRLEQDVEGVGAGRRHVTDVLTEGVPVAPVAGHGAAQRLAQRRPHAVGPDDVVGPYLAPAAPQPQRHAAVVLDGVGERRALGDLGPGRPGHVEEGGVEIGPAGHDRVEAPPPGQR